MCEGQLQHLKGQLREAQETNLTFCVLGTGLSRKPAQQFRDGEDDLGIDLYSESYSDGTPSGTSLNKSQLIMNQSRVSSTNIPPLNHQISGVAETHVWRPENYVLEHKYGLCK